MTSCSGILRLKRILIPMCAVSVVRAKGKTYVDDELQEIELEQGRSVGLYERVKPEGF